MIWVRTLSLVWAAVMYSASTFPSLHKVFKVKAVSAERGQLSQSKASIGVRTLNQQVARVDSPITSYTIGIVYVMVCKFKFKGLIASQVVRLIGLLLVFASQKMVHVMSEMKWQSLLCH